MRGGQNGGLAQFETSGGASIFRLPQEAFPGFPVYSYLVRCGDYTVLIDCGSGMGESNEDLEAGFATISHLSGTSIGLDDLTHILITHGHIDHFGGLSYLRDRTDASIGIHELDRRIISCHEERYIVVYRRLKEYLQEAGLPPDQLQRLLQLYSFPKSLYRSVAVDFGFLEIGMELGPLKFLHVPGHGAGHVVIRLHDILFSGDHVLAEISPQQTPEHLSLSTGLGHYLESLDKLLDWAGDVRLTLGGHRAPIQDLEGRVDEIRSEHAERLAKIRSFLDNSKTILDISNHLFGPVDGYNELLALEEAGAHVEYLYQRGEIGIDNISEVERCENPIPLRYIRL